MNLMAERIDELVSQLSAISGALAHDLRSPSPGSRRRSTRPWRVDEPGAADALQAARADADALRSMLENALEISRLEGGAIQDRACRWIWPPWPRIWSNSTSRWRNNRA
jgi:signal transduction histidine kinase